MKHTQREWVDATMVLADSYALALRRGPAAQVAAARNALHMHLGTSPALQVLDASANRWPFVESPGAFAQRLESAMHEFGGVLPAVRRCLIEQPPKMLQATPIEELIEDAIGACWSALVAMGRQGANSDVRHPLRDSWERCRAVVSAAPFTPYNRRSG
jgi:hypothetical protein